MTTEKSKRRPFFEQRAAIFVRGDEVIHRWLRREIRPRFLANDE
jgi:hypothetical protein